LTEPNKQYTGDPAANWAHDFESAHRMPPKKFFEGTDSDWVLS